MSHCAGGGYVSYAHSGLGRGQRCLQATGQSDRCRMVKCETQPRSTCREMSFTNTLTSPLGPSPSPIQITQPKPPK